MVTPSLALSQQQRQVQILAPQLRQSLEILQLPVLELRTIIQNELQQNPTLEEATTEPTSISAEEGKNKADDIKELNFEKEFEILSRIDEEWANYFMQEEDNTPYDSTRQKSRDFFLSLQVQKESLQEHLRQQLILTSFNEQDRQIAELIIGNINDDGYLTQNIKELAENTGTDLTHIQSILSLIQEFDPVGVGCQNITECLLLQIERLGKADSLASKIIKEHLDLLGKKKFKEIAHAMNTSPEEVQQAAKLISTLEPKPGRAFSLETPYYILPEVFVEKVNGKYVVMVNDDQTPHVRISDYYKKLMNDEHTTQDAKDYIKEHIRSAFLLIKSITQRKQTLFKVASQIVKEQTAFFEHGISYLKPLTMMDVAKAIGMHETTVCRCIANKYIKTPRGIFEMKYFFTPGLATANGEIISTQTIKNKITNIVAKEHSARPLSDHDILEKLKAEGINIARRTIAKYRIALQIPPAHLRKSG